LKEWDIALISTIEIFSKICRLHFYHPVARPQTQKKKAGGAAAAGKQDAITDGQTVVTAVLTQA
jgi:hypothetical protein